MTTVDIKAARISVTDTASLFGLTRQRMWQLGEEKILPVSNDEGYLLADVVSAYIRHIRDDPRRIADAKLKEAKQRKIELEIAQKAGQLIDADDAGDAVHHYTAMLINNISALPKAVTRDLAMRKEIEKYIDDCLARHGREWTAAIERMKRGEDPFGDEATNED